MIPIILSGGSGTRLWPISRKNKPKQFINFIGDETMFTQTIKRFQNKEKFQDPIILGSLEHKHHIEKEIKKNVLESSEVLLEPKAMNTAPAICATIEYLYKNNKKDEIVIFCPSDAYIEDNAKFEKYLLIAEKQAKQNKLVIFGIKPSYAEIGYGYIELDKNINNEVFSVKKFKEKPNIEKAEEFLKDKKHLWNAGIFMAKVSTLYDLFKKFKNDLLKNIEKTIKRSIKENNYIYINKEFFTQCEKTSIDYAIIENLNSDNLVVISMDLLWSDLGSFQSLHNLQEKTKDNNITKGNVITNNVKNCYIQSDKNIICCSDIDNLVVVENDGVIMIIKKENSQNVKKLIEKIKEVEFYEGIL